jgi:hypothetical protein
MKSGNDADGVSLDVEKQPRETRTRFLTAAFATLLILLGLESSFPMLKYQLLPWLDTRHASSNKHFDWDDVSGF